MVGFVPNELSSIVDTVATSISAAYYDTGTFLTKISAAASAVASASLSDALEDSDTAKSFFTDAEIEFVNANRFIDDIN